MVKGRHAWSCRICWASSRTRANLAHARCAGPAAARWAKRERQLCTTGVVVGPRHVRIMTDNIIWCLRCGHYAERFAVSLAKPCSGHPTSAGTRACRNRLSRFMHPRTKAPIAGPHFPESMHARNVLTGPEGLIAWGSKSDAIVAVSGSATSHSLAPPPTRLRLLARHFALSNRSPPPAPEPTPCKRRRLIGKQPLAAGISNSPVLADVDACHLTSPISFSPPACPKELVPSRSTTGLLAGPSSPRWQLASAESALPGKKRPPAEAQRAALLRNLRARVDAVPSSSGAVGSAGCFTRMCNKRVQGCSDHLHCERTRQH